MESVNIETLSAKAQEFFQSLSFAQWAIIAGIFFVLFVLIPIIKAKRRQRSRQRIAPKLLLDTFQISPLGRDAYFKIRNNGEQATLLSLFVRGRRDVVPKNAFVGHQIEKEKVYGILLEATAADKLADNFSIEITYLDKIGNVYKQSFELGNKMAKQPKLVKAK